MDYSLLGKNIKKYRKLRGLTQEKLSENIYISPVFMSQIETASRKPSLETVVNIADCLKVSVDLLINDTFQNKEAADYISPPLTNEQLNILSFALQKRSAEEISALLKSLTHLLDFT